MREIDVGQTIAGKYELVRLIGRGAMGAVWLARHDTLGEKFAIKLLTPDPSVDLAEASGRFQQEAQLSATLSRKTRHVVRVTDHGEEDGWAYLVMELLEGESLEQRLERGPLEAAETADIIGQVARALTVAHAEGILHRDLKPGNIFLTHDEEGRLLVKLLDFGIARSVRPRKTRSPFATGRDMVLGTPSYMSPEQARGLDELDHRCDLWALAVVGYEALTGTIPWNGETVEDVFISVCTHQWVPARDRRPDLPYVVEAFFARAFAFELDERFGSAKEVAATFRAAFPHTSRAAGGRAAFASRPSFDEELGAVGKLPSPVPASDTAPLAPATVPPPSPRPVASDRPRSRPSRDLTESDAKVLPRRAPASTRWGIGLALVAASVVVAGLAAWATSASPAPSVAPVTSGSVGVVGEGPARDVPPPADPTPAPAAPRASSSTAESITPAPRGSAPAPNDRRRPPVAITRPTSVGTAAPAVTPAKPPAVAEEPREPPPRDKGEVF